MFLDDVQSVLTTASASASSTPTESQLVLLCLDYLRDLRRAFSTNHDDLLVAEGIDGDYITLAIWALSRSFVKPEELQVSSKYMCVSDDVLQDQVSKAHKGNINFNAWGNDPWFEVENAEPTVLRNRLKPQEQKTFSISSKMRIPTLQQMEKELLYSSCPKDSKKDRSLDDDYYMYPINWYEHDENHYSNNHRFYVQSGLSDGPPLSLGELAVAGLAGLNARSRHDADLDLKSSPLFEQFVKAVESKGFFDPAEGEEMTAELYDERFAKVVAKFRSKLASKAEQEQAESNIRRFQPESPSPQHTPEVLPEVNTAAYGISSLESPSNIKQRRLQQLSKMRTPRNQTESLQTIDARQPNSTERQPQRPLSSRNHHSEQNQSYGSPSMRAPSPNVQHAEQSVSERLEKIRRSESPSMSRNVKGNDMKMTFSFTKHDPSYKSEDRSSTHSRTPTKGSRSRSSSSQRDNETDSLSRPSNRSSTPTRNSEHSSIESRQRSRSVTKQKKIQQSEPMRGMGSPLEETLRRIDREHKSGTIDGQSRKTGQAPSLKRNTEKQKIEYDDYNDDAETKSVAKSIGNSTYKSIAFSDSEAGDDVHSNPDELVTINEDDQSIVELERAEHLKSNGNIHMQNRDYQSAVEAYTAALLICPSGRTSHVYFSNRAAAYLSLKKFEEAISDCQRSLELNPNYGKAHSRLGLAHFLLGQYEQAVEAYLGAVAIEPNNATANSYLEKSKKKLEQKASKKKKKTNKSRKSRGSGNVQGGLPTGDSFSVNHTEYSKSSTKDRSDSRSRSLRKFDDEVSSVGSTSIKSQLSPEERVILQRADKHKSEGNKLMAAKQYERAVRSYGNALRESSDGIHSHIYYSNRAAALCYLECYNEAEKDALASLALRPDYAKAHARLGLSRYSQSNYEGAVSAYRNALLYGPDSVASKSYLAKAEAKLAKQKQRMAAGKR